MLPKIKVRAEKEDLEAYQSLLRADWSKDTLNDALRLLWKLVAESCASGADATQQILNLDSQKSESREFNEQIIQGIRELAEVFADPALPCVPQVVTNARSNRAALVAEKTWAYLTLQTRATLAGDVGLFRDTQSVLFLTAIHYLLPQLKSPKLRWGRDCLLNAMFVHTVIVWREQPEHLHYLQSAIMEELGLTKRRLELLDRSLRLTPVEDHSYVTKACALWCDLIDNGEQKKALDLLLFLNKIAPPSCTDEITEMIADTLRLRVAS